VEEEALKSEAPFEKRDEEAGGGEDVELALEKRETPFEKRDEEAGGGEDVVELVLLLKSEMNGRGSAKTPGTVSKQIKAAVVFMIEF